MLPRRGLDVAVALRRNDNAVNQAFPASARFLDPRPEFRCRGILVELRDRRRGELHGLRESDSARLIEMYRQVARLDDDRPLPLGTTFVSIVEAILDHENTQHAFADEPL